MTFPNVGGKKTARKRENFWMEIENESVTWSQRRRGRRGGCRDPRRAAPANGCQPLRTAELQKFKFNFF